MGSLGRLVFFGTPEFAVPSLEALVKSGWAPVKVYTQPSRPSGRGRRVHPSAVARRARDLGLDVEEVAAVRETAFLSALRVLGPDLAVVVAFGQIFPAELLRVPKRGCVNVHASLLPAFRGAAPVQAAILDGSEETGVTTMLMDEGMDTGPILLQRRTRIEARETSGELTGRLAVLGAELLIETLRRLEEGDLEPKPQPEIGVSYAPRLSRESGTIDWRAEAEEIFRRLRAFTPWPGLTTSFRGQPLKIVWGEPLGPLPGMPLPGGSLVLLEDGDLAVACGGKRLFRLDRVQRPGRRVVTGREFRNGEQPAAGERME